jgi:hypothetical protein
MKILIDTGANGLSFMNIHTAILLAKHFQTPIIPLDSSIPVAGFDGKPSTPMTHALVLTLIVDG